MKYIDEYRDETVAGKLVKELRRIVTRPWVLMEVCGGQTHTIVKNGIDHLLPEEIELVHGPGELDGEHTRRDPVLHAQEAKQDVLRADVVVVEHPRFLLRAHHHLPGLLGKALEHSAKDRSPRPLSATPRA